VTVEVLPVEGIGEIRPGDDLGELIADALRPMRVRVGDVGAGTQKIV
jgi:F420-0:gamma-glutamyl ligase